MRRAVRLVAVTAGLCGAAAFSLAVATARSLVVPKPRPMDDRILGLDRDAALITVNSNADTSTPGRFGLFTSGSRPYVQLGAVVEADGSTVTRTLETPVAAGETLDPECSFSAWYFDQPEQLGLDFQHVSVPSAAGEFPAWLFPAEPVRGKQSPSWVIHVHGRGVRRAECLRAVGVFHELGLPSLIVSYRNDGEGPRTAHGSYGLGMTEWHDVEAAIAFAIDHGAEQIVLQGYSMGGAIVFQTLLQSVFRERIVGLVLDSPVIDWKSVLAVHAHEGRVPGPIARLAMQLLKHPLTARLCGADEAIALDAMNMNARADELREPILLLVSSGDNYVPDGPAIELSVQRPDIVTRVQFSRPPHTALWNYDEALWNGSIRSWLHTNGLV